MSFGKWLVKQLDRDDEIGELARYLWNDASGPLWSSKPDVYRSYLAVYEKRLVMVAALEKALAEWQVDEDE